jgi:hypothetical protein
MSSGWYKNVLKHDPARLDQIKAAPEYWFKITAQTSANDNAWTAYSKVKPRLKGARYARGWIPNNAKATNEHRHKKSLAYLCNLFHNPYIKGYFEDRGIRVYEDLFALSELVQWIWRSQIRDDQPITVFIPSERMRNLFNRWLNSASVVDWLETEHSQAA